MSEVLGSEVSAASAKTLKRKKVEDGEVVSKKHKSKKQKTKNGAVSDVVKEDTFSTQEEVIPLDAPIKTNGTSSKKDETKIKTKNKSKDKKLKTATNETVAGTEKSQTEETHDVQADAADAVSSTKEKKSKKSRKSTGTTTTEPVPTPNPDVVQDTNDATATATASDPSKSDSKSKTGRFIAFIGNLPYDTTTEALKLHFESIRPDGIRHMTERDKKDKYSKETRKNKPKSKGYAFLEFNSYDRLLTCLKLYHHSYFSADPTLRGMEHEGGQGTTRRINVELTAGGGGKGQARKEKLRTKNERLADERARRAKKEKKLRKDKKSTKGEAKSDGGAGDGEVDGNKTDQVDVHAEKSDHPNDESAIANEPVVDLGNMNPARMVMMEKVANGDFADERRGENGRGRGGHRGSGGSSRGGRGRGGSISRGRGGGGGRGGRMRGSNSESNANHVQVRRGGRGRF